MSIAPGVQVTTTIAKRKKRTGIVPGTVFMPVVSIRGPHDRALEIGSLAEFVAAFGARDTASLAYDALDILFQEGMPRAFVTRIVGVTPVKASKALVDAGAATVLTITAKEYGAYWNATTVANVVSGGNFTLTITEPDGTVYTSGLLADTAAAVVWVATLANFTAVSAGSNDPATLAAAAMTGGTDDRATISETQRQTASNVLEKKYGCGVYIETGATSAAAELRIAAHCAATNRIAITDIADGTSVAASVTQAGTEVNTANARRVKLNRSYANVAGLTAGTTRILPWSVIEAGIMGANDAKGVPVGQPASGRYGVSKTALSLVTEFNDTDRATLNDARVNVAIADTDTGDIMGYGNRSLSTAAGETQFSVQRTLMVIQAECELAAKAYVHRLVDGDQHVLGELLKDLIGICQNHRLAGDLFGKTDAEAFAVLVFEVNTQDDLLAGIINATVDVLPSGAAEFVRINITAHADTIGA